MRTILTILMLLLASPALAQNHIAAVERAKELNDHLEGRAQACAIAAQVAWDLRLHGWGHVVKVGAQNGCEGPQFRHAIDAVVMKDTGACIDFLVSVETDNIPAWNPCSAPFMDPALWRAPYKPEDAPGTPTDPDPANPPSGDLEAVLSLLGEFQASTNRKLADLEAVIKAHAAAVVIPPTPIDPNEKGWLQRWVFERALPFLATVWATYAATKGGEQ